MRELSDPNLTRDELIAVRQIALSLMAGYLTLEEAERAVSRVSAKFSALFSTSGQAGGGLRVAAIIQAVEAILQVRR